MSNIALSWAFKCHVGNASAKAVLVYLADRADDDGTAAYPKIATIVNVTELSERTVRTALKTLQERGFIRRGDQRYALIVISTFALDFIHTDRSVFKIVDLDEAWSFLQVAQGKTLSMKLVRAGRAMNAGVYFVTQNTDDLLDEKLKNNLGLKFAFRSTDINEIKKTLAFFGVDSEDENNQKRLRDLENGQCLISDLYGRVGVIQFHPIFEDLFHAFDTRPPVRKEVEE